MTTEKGKTIKKWTSNEEYRNNHDAIFGKKTKCRNGRRVDDSLRDLGECTECEGTACEESP